MLGSYPSALLRALEERAANRVYYVDCVNGNDARYPGRSKHRPFKTIYRARHQVNSLIDWAASPWLKKYSIIYVAPGVYQEAIAMPFCGAIIGTGVLGTDTATEIHPTSGSAVRNPPQAVDGSFAGSLTSRTDDNTGVFTASAGGHNVVTGDDVDFYWQDPEIDLATVRRKSGYSSYLPLYSKCRLNMDATVAANAITIDGGQGDALPAKGTAGYMIEQSGGSVASQVSGCTALASILFNLWFECESAVPCMRFGIFNNSIIANCVIARGIAGLSTNAMEFDNVSHAHIIGNRIESGVVDFTKGMVFNGGANQYLHASHIHDNFINAVTAGIEIAADCTATGALIKANVIQGCVKGIDDNNGNSLCVGNFIRASSDAIEHAAGSSKTIGNWVVDNVTPALEPVHVPP